MNHITPPPAPRSTLKPPAPLLKPVAAAAGRGARRAGERDPARRRVLVMVAKRVLPLAALLLLAVVIAWPELHRDTSLTRVAGSGQVGEPASGEMAHGRYNGVNENGEPFTVTADTAHQTAPDHIDLGSPVGDISLHGGSWLQVKGQRGVFDQQSGLLDLSGEVSLYRDDGTRMETDTATIDTKRGAGSSADKVHAEGPFGTLDAQGFVLLDRGAVIQFSGPGRLLLQGAGK
jgi:lipopolysaccharide export system protein LptC